MLLSASPRATEQTGKLVSVEAFTYTSLLLPLMTHSMVGGTLYMPGESGPIRLPVRRKPTRHAVLVEPTNWALARLGLEGGV